MRYQSLKSSSTRARKLLLFGLTLALAVSVLAVRAVPSFADLKNNPDPTTLCTDPDGCTEAPDDPNINTWDNAPGGGPNGSPSGYTCGYPDALGAEYSGYPQATLICVKPGSPVISCTRSYFLWIIPTGWDCSRP